MTAERGLLTEAEIRVWAERRFGYGRWDAPYWFIGPEEGMDKLGLGTTETKLRAWLDMECPEVCDCKIFHAKINFTKWHDPPPPLQSTWRPLMLLLMTVRKLVAADDEDGAMQQKRLHRLPQLEKSLRIYQRCHWGMSDGETCVIELSAFPAKDLKAGKKEKSLFLNDAELKQVSEQRAIVIRDKILDLRKPSLVVFYGLDKRQKRFWKDIIAGPIRDVTAGEWSTSIQEIGSVVIALTPHPGARGLKNAYWIALGRKLRDDYPLLARQAVP